MEKGKIIFLNGVTSSGKTSIVEALQDTDDIFFYVVANDLFEEMIGEKYLRENYWKYLSEVIIMMYHTAKLYSDMGKLWGSLFFIFMSFAAFSTILAVFENIISCGMELTGWSRKKSSFINAIAIILLSVPCVLGYNLWSSDIFAVFGGAVLDFEDFLVSNLFLPLGSLVYLLFCTSRYGWGWKNFTTEANTGKGLKIQNWMRGYISYILPLIVLFIFFFGLYDKF